MPANVSATAKPGFFLRFFGNLRATIRRIFGKQEEAPNIYPFF